MNLSDKQQALLAQRIDILTAERDRIIAESNRTISWLNGRIAELTYWLTDTAVAPTPPAEEAPHEL